MFCPVFFDNIAQSPDVYDIWAFYFPQEWKITKENLEDVKLSPITNLILQEYLKWTVYRIRNPQDTFDEALDNVSLNLFPEIEPRMWAKILVFLFQPYGEHKLKSVIESPKVFSMIGRVYDVGFASLDKKVLEQENNTIELACYLFKDSFSKEALEKYLEELDKLEIEYEKHSREERRRIGYINLFQKMLEHLKGNQE